MRRLISGIACALALLGTSAAWAQPTASGYPNKPVRMIVPFAPAGPTDVIARIVAQKLSDQLKQQFVVENQPGAGGNIGITAVARAPADGYTLVVVSSGFLVNPSLYEKSPYDAVKDFAPITLAAASPNVMVVHPSVPAKSVKEMVELIKASPGKYNFAMPGTGTTPHLSGELFKLSFKLDLVTVPFGGAGPAIQSTLAGHTPMAFTALPPAAPQIREGKLRGLAVLSTKRSPAIPEVPTIGEAGSPGQESETLQGVLAPAGTPPDIIAKLHTEIVKIVAMPDVKQRLESLGFEAVANTPDEFAARIKSEMAQWAKVIADAKLPKL